ncbi:MAG: hypothetical protein R3C59_25485 [Planctomycetaceae bacterium]
MDYVFAFNAFEAVLWTIFGVSLLVRAVTHPSQRGRCLLAAITFIVFAGSELMEMQTGAWWRPWWLFLWKALCVTSLVVLAVAHYRNVRANSGTQTPTDQPTNT